MSSTIPGKTTRATRTARIRLFDCALMLFFAFLLGILWRTTTTPTYYQVIKLEKLGEAPPHRLVKLLHHSHR